MIDTGASCHILSPDDIDKENRKKIKSLDSPFHLTTANGRIEVDKCIRARNGKAGRSYEAIVLEDSPPVISVGQWCMKDGWSFKWPAYGTPYLVNPKGKKKINLAVHHYVPYLTEKGGTAKRPTRIANLSKVIGFENSIEENPIVNRIAEDSENSDTSEDEEVLIASPIICETDNEEESRRVPTTKSKVSTERDKPWLTIEHLMSHRPKMINCPICKRAKA